MLHILVGISGSGKSWKARRLLTQYGGPTKAAIVGRDKIRELVLGHSEQSIKEHYNSPDFMEIEKEITKYEDSLIRYNLQLGKFVISDNTHLRKKYLDRYAKFGVPVVYDLIECDFDTALERDSRRIRQVGSEVLKKQWESLKRLKEDFDFKPWYPTTFCKAEYDNSKADAIVVDIDGTIALNNGQRSPFDWKMVYKDVPNDAVVKVLKLIEKGRDWKQTKIIVCSGRDACCFNETVAWLDMYGIIYDEIFMRQENDNRADYIVKEEFWREIQKSYNIVAFFDDRNQVVDHARRLGFTVLQVAEGDF